jgi:hypothetical protein
VLKFNDLFELDRTDRGDFWEGRTLTANKWAATVYLVIAFGALIIFALTDHHSKLDLFSLMPSERLLLIGLGVVVTAGPPAWFWVEARAFDYWVNKKCKDDDKAEKRFRETFKVNADNEKAFWAAIVAVYAAVLIKW